MRLSNNFMLTEFNCHDGSRVPDKLLPNVQALAMQLQIIREELGEGLTILSGYRTAAWNIRVGGKPKSMHLEAKAADLTAKNYTPKQLHKAILKLIKEGRIKDGGLGLYPGFVHYDIGHARRW